MKVACPFPLTSWTQKGNATNAEPGIPGFHMLLELDRVVLLIIMLG